MAEEQKTIRRYWVFNIYKYYPSGGMGDFEGSYDTIEEIPPKSDQYDFREVFDSHTMRVKLNDDEWEPLIGYGGAT